MLQLRVCGARILSAIPQETQRRFHPLHPLPQTGDRAGRQQGRGASGLERSGPETPPPGALLGQRSSPEFESKATDIIGLYNRTRTASCTACRRVLRRRKNRHPSPGSARSRSAAFAGTSGASWLRVLPAWNAYSVCHGVGHPDRPVCTERTTARTPAGTSWPSSKGYYRCARPGSPGDSPSSSTTSPAHKTQLVRDFLQQHPRVQLHFTPTYSSWKSTKWRSGS